MKRKMTVISAKIKEKGLFLETAEDLTGLMPGEQMLVDSDHFAFIYIMEDQEDYTYIELSEQIWPQLKAPMEKKLSVWICNVNQEIMLQGFWDELEYLIENIKGNSNYGQEMVNKVEGFF
ncbi:hypothetical protein HPT25_13815 [Bacillus sp. BRMEA1]|uniref:UPF0738 family protein n=1 Tax=Neobacillus endophyticus TaxID=2738405 RepID=UPI0015644EED|nr:hypothetical protein [Neobacillus endophyticus]NRD78445.1 hypothetical protein [Neobacillus endophyticus]